MEFYLCDADDMNSFVRNDVCVAHSSIPNDIERKTEKWNEMIRMLTRQIDKMLWQPSHNEMCYEI